MDIQQAVISLAYGLQLVWDCEFHYKCLQNMFNQSDKAVFTESKWLLKWTAQTKVVTKMFSNLTQTANIPIFPI